MNVMMQADPDPHIEIVQCAQQGIVQSDTVMDRVANEHGRVA